MLICSWCRIQYDGNPLYHICPDGMTFDKRSEKNTQEILDEYARQDKIKIAYKNAMRKNVRHEGPMIMNWTPEDMEFLIALHIDPIGDDYDKD
jgi:hypothetical protein